MKLSLGTPDLRDQMDLDVLLIRYVDMFALLHPNRLSARPPELEMDSEATACVQQERTLQLTSDACHFQVWGGTNC